MKVLLTGAAGQLGKSIVERAPKGWSLITFSSDELNITKPAQVDKELALHEPDVVINAAAYTAVDHAESDEIKAREINGRALKYLGVKCAELDALLVHVSTDYVFDGRASLPYRETDPINPLNIYGKTKAEGEQAVMRSGARYIIIRTSWVFSEYGNNFLKTMMRLGSERQTLNVVSDQMGAPTYAGDIATVIIKLLQDQNISRNEIYHYCGDQITSWADFAKFIFDSAFENGKLPYQVLVNNITTDVFDAAAPRPKNSVLDCRKIKDFSDISLSDWQGAVRKIINDHY